MTRRAFRPAIRLLFLTVLIAGLRAGNCPDDYTPASFEAASDELSDFLDEYFTDTNLSLPPTDPQRRRLGLRQDSDGGWTVPGSLRRIGRRSYPVHPGIWRVEEPGGGLSVIHVLLKEPAPLAETEAFNSINDLLGDPYADYDNPAYGMILQPEEIRRLWRDRYLGIGVRVYGVSDDATGLESTYTDIILTDYTPWVERAMHCKESHEAAAAGR